MTQALWPQVFQSHCKPGPVLGGSDELTAILGRYQQQIPVWQANLADLGAQVKQSGDTLSAIATGLEELATKGTGEDVSSTVRCLEQKMAEAECEIARHHVRIGAIEVQFNPLALKLAAFEGKVDQWQVEAGKIPGLSTKVEALGNNVVEWKNRLSTKADTEQLQAFAYETKAAVAELSAWIWWLRLLHLAVPGCPATPYSRLLGACEISSVADLAGAQSMSLLETLNAHRETPEVHGRKFEMEEVEAMIRTAKQMRQGLEVGS